jgi:hypothetical protein
MAPIFTGFRMGFGRVDAPSGSPGAQTFSSSQVFSYTGSPQTFSVPSNTTFVRAKVWSAGGGGSFGPGGAGGMVDAYIPVIQNDTLTIYVAGGGNNTPAPGGPAGSGGYGYGNGGPGGVGDGAGSNGNGGGGGGGSSAIINPQGTNIIASGGGGSGGQRWDGTGIVYPGGNGPGNSSGGSAYTAPFNGAAGSNQAGGGGAGGSGSSSANSPGQGGQAGTNVVPTPTPYGTNTGYYGSGTTGANTSDPDWSPGISQGSPSGVSGAAGGHGKIVIYYTP